MGWGTGFSFVRLHLCEASPDCFISLFRLLLQLLLNIIGSDYYFFLYGVDIAPDELCLHLGTSGGNRMIG
jgi:hypothetical protein